MVKVHISTHVSTTAGEENSETWVVALELETIPGGKRTSIEPPTKNNRQLDGWDDELVSFFAVFFSRARGRWLVTW